ncbi:MAG: hypothetical protein E7075_01940 [Bacteroidales bacterium]|nr:hypothetical protein [Bacteroidales bacterium]
MRLLAIGYWLLVIGYWLLAIGNWQLVITRLLTTKKINNYNNEENSFIRSDPFRSNNVNHGN